MWYVEIAGVILQAPDKASAEAIVKLNPGSSCYSREILVLKEAQCKLDEARETLAEAERACSQALRRVQDACEHPEIRRDISYEPPYCGVCGKENP